MANFFSNDDDSFSNELKLDELFSNELENLEGMKLELNDYIAFSNQILSFFDNYNDVFESKYNEYNNLAKESNETKEYRFADSNSYDHAMRDKTRINTLNRQINYDIVTLKRDLETALNKIETFTENFRNPENDENRETLIKHMHKNLKRHEKIIKENKNMGDADIDAGYDYQIEYEICPVCQEPLDNVHGPGNYHSIENRYTHCNINCNDVIRVCDLEKPLHYLHRGCAIDICNMGSVDAAQQMGLNFTFNMPSQKRGKCPLCVTRDMNVDPTSVSKVPTERLVKIVKILHSSTRSGKIVKILHSSTRGGKKTRKNKRNK